MAAGNGKGKPIVCIGDKSSHGGTIIISNQVDDKLLCNDLLVALETMPEGTVQHSCPIPYHGITPVTAITVKSYHNGKLILTGGAQAACGAVLTPVDRKVYVE